MRTDQRLEGKILEDLYPDWETDKEYGEGYW